MSIRSVVPAAMACAVGVSLGSIAPAAAEPSRLAIELNALKSAASDCQMALLFTNGLAIDIDALALELVVFDGDGVMDRVLRVKSSDLPAGRKRLKLFKLEGLDCAAVGSILVNDVTDCDGAGLDRKTCADAVQASHKTTVPFMR